eukprot:CAMPEP_0179281576 /NCGR_PEP_ID=MMETSP0797-20121207/37225_1 /TAXON_ID=47934 /ORGANISM="Dinophysis acuminata, Strain DAEP01" /LENGTH=65 /DNA_ID=CAMNT_0020990289 /DNA_START=118 /DNA_END=313 /DNA_ORIENTATION=-
MPGIAPTGLDSSFANTTTPAGSAELPELVEKATVGHGGADQQRPQATPSAICAHAGGRAGGQALE